MHSANEIRKTCPFCGEHATISVRSGDERDGYCDTHTITCSGCGCRISASGDTSKGGYADNSKVRSNLLTKWNKRTI